MDQSVHSENTRISFLIRFSSFLKALWIFFPGFIFLFAALFIFIDLPQGRDIIYQSTDGAYSFKTGLYLVLGTIFWVLTTWYTARLIAYNREDLYQRSPAVLYHFPRLLGYSVFLVLWLSVFLIDDIDHGKRAWAWVAAFIDQIVYCILYVCLSRQFEGQFSVLKIRVLSLVRWVIRSIMLVACLVIIFNWKENQVNVLLFTLPLLQVCFLFLIMIRHPLFKNNPLTSKRRSADEEGYIHTWADRYMRWVFLGTSHKFDLNFEKNVFFVYHFFALVALLSYLLAVNVLSFAREITSFPLVMLAFGIMLGIINILSFLSYRRQVNLNFLIIGLIILGGFFFETHNVQLTTADRKGDKIYDRRLSFQAYVEHWINWHKEELDKDTLPYPVYFILSDGGASRSGYWSASVLGSLHESTRYRFGSNRSYFADHLFCLSGASGGSVGNAVFLAALAIHQKHPDVNTETLCKDYLSNDFLVYPLAHLLGPDLIQPAFGYLSFWNDRAAALERSMDDPDNDTPLGKLTGGSFAQLLPDDVNSFPILSMNTTRVNDGSPGVVSNIHIGGSAGAFGQRIDVLDSLQPGQDIKLSTAMVLGARFPYFSPGGRINNSYYVDGGYFDNSGAGIVHEMIQELNRIAAEPYNALGKYLKRLHFYVIHLSNTPYNSTTVNRRIHPVLNDLITPALTLAGSYSSQTAMSDARLINYLKELNKENNSYFILNLYRKDTVESLPMNWVISNRVRAIMNKRIHEKPALDTLISRINRGTRDSLFAGMEIEN